MSIGTLNTFDLLATRFRPADTRPGEICERESYERIKQAFDAHNGIMRDMIADLADFTTARDAEMSRLAPMPERVETWRDRPPLLW
jgi:hypothetical protein